MRRTLTAAGSMLAVLTMAPLAMAQSRTEFGQQGEFIISADRLVPLLSFEDVSQDVLVPGGLPNNVKSETTTQTATSFSVLYGSPAAPVEQFYSVPRIGFDYVVVPNVTIGGNLIAVFSLGGSSKQETARQTRRARTAPRRQASGSRPAPATSCRSTTSFHSGCAAAFRTSSGPRSSPTATTGRRPRASTSLRSIWSRRWSLPRFLTSASRRDWTWTFLSRAATESKTTTAVHHRASPATPPSSISARSSGC